MSARYRYAAADMPTSFRCLPMSARFVYRNADVGPTSVRRRNAAIATWRLRHVHHVYLLIRRYSSWLSLPLPRCSSHPDADVSLISACRSAASHADIADIGPMSARYRYAAADMPTSFRCLPMSARFVYRNADVGPTSVRRRNAAIATWRLRHVHHVYLLIRRYSSWLSLPLPRCSSHPDADVSLISACRSAASHADIADIGPMSARYRYVGPFCVPRCRRRADVGPTSSCRCRDSDVYPTSADVGPTSACSLGRVLRTVT